MQSTNDNVFLSRVSAYSWPCFLGSITIFATFCGGCCQPLVKVIPANSCPAPVSVCSVDPVCTPTVCSGDGIYSEHSTILDRLQLGRLQAGHRIGQWSSKASSCMHDNALTRKIEAHRAEKLAAKNAPPWPSFHPLPTEPVFFAAESLEASEDVENSGMTPNYGQFASPEDR